MISESMINMKRIDREKYIIIILTIIIFILLGSIVYFITKKDNNITENDTTYNQNIFLEFNENIEYGTTWKYDDFINNYIDQNKLDNDSTITILLGNNSINENSEFTFNEIKNYYLEITVTNNIDTITKTYNLEVVDTIPPIINGLNSKTIYERETIDLKEGITAIDNVDGEIEVTISNENNSFTEGTYTIMVSATDKNNNTSEEAFTLTVLKKQTTTTEVIKENTTKKTTTTKKATTTIKTTTTISMDPSTKTGRLNLAKAEAKRVASEIIKPGMTDEQKAYAIFNYLHSNVDLQTNQSSEAYKTNFGNEAYAALIMKIAACSGFCRAVTLLCNEAGLQSEHINANAWTHQWNRVLINGEWIILDAQGGIFGGTTHPLEY